MADTEHKESAWWKPALSFLLAGAKAIVVIVTVLAVLIVDAEPGSPASLPLEGRD